MQSSRKRTNGCGKKIIKIMKRWKTLSWFRLELLLRGDRAKRYDVNDQEVKEENEEEQDDGGGNDNDDEAKEKDDGE